MNAHVADDWRTGRFGPADDDQFAADRGHLRDQSLDVGNDRARRINRRDNDAKRAIASGFAHFERAGTASAAEGSSSALFIVAKLTEDGVGWCSAAIRSRSDIR